MSQRFITPRKILSARFKEKAQFPRWEAAVLCFRDLLGSRALVEALNAKPLKHKVLWGMDIMGGVPDVHETSFAGMQIGVVMRCFWGGPQAAILIEELAELGVHYVIGYGASGSLDAKLPRGSQLVIEKALLTDNTSHYYAKEDALPSKFLLDAAPLAIRVTAATMDAIYRETRGQVLQWRKQGAQVVNMEAAPFYAAAKKCRIKALWLGHVSDMVIGKWHDWHIDRNQMNRETITNCQAVLSAISAKKTKQAS